MKNLELGGIYEHYKGTRVRVLFEAIESETKEHLVIYMHLEDGVIWARPKHMFLENIILDGKETERFKKIDQEVLIKPNEKHS
ncbi:MAG: hypothetical protein UU13_C0012G0006 [Candidatus Nomurabacteria bacterium GW2011_GWB1_40_7]|uniref:DUF1653 domain-containing protein n=1 Tax=Candidatus Nomurabacteria bacterium GW2011_GWB1_40_7 TaxID=1618744 RepID=A0A0G0VDS0_9BACT|nr:MAG: hypothetical protein UU13_C0012G0006 [Candidatus Nomurabacteria bacterium GW2011_GWB1_40_7]